MNIESGASISESLELYLQASGSSSGRVSSVSWGTPSTSGSCATVSTGAATPATLTLPSIGYSSATDIREGSDGNFLVILNDTQASGAAMTPGAAGALAVFNRSIGPFEAGRTDVGYLPSVRVLSAALAMAYKLLDAAQARWRRFNGHELVADVLAGIKFKDGIKVTEDNTTTPDEKVAA